VDAEGGLVFCFDGRLDNPRDLIALLPSDRRPSSPAPDSILALAAYKVLGARCPERFVGDYVLAAWHPAERRLYCIRSPGEWRPLFWCETDSLFAFATEPMQLFAGAPPEKQANEPALGELLALRFSTPVETLFKGVYRLRPGWSLTVERGTVRHDHWYRGPFEPVRLNDDTEYIERFRDLFDQALASCLRCNTAVVASLSRGLDSSSVVCRSAELHRSGRVARMPQPVSLVYPGLDLTDESQWIDIVAAHAGAEPIRAEPAAYDWDEIASWTAHTGFLPLRTNGHSLTSIYRSVRDADIRVLITGEGGDDWLSGGYAHWPELVRTCRFVQLVREGFDSQFGGSVGSRARRIVGHGVMPLIYGARRKAAVQPQFDPDDSVPEWISPDWARSIALADRLAAAPQIPDGLRLHRQTLYANVERPRHHINIGPALAWAGQAGIEMRHPFHDRRLAEFVTGSPGRLFRRGETRK